ncbi:hypothetical protein [Ureibacillus aquaedulcis]|uniref:DUF5659 domain-containing protein n=1 Tax=Ureibacillus aquaedulcis TaxID=3058421 RepID=A0ABT8GN80_9BACL|nr:hypothetical protein [Ureibacillus sp. BA0131]MDN4492878.1 hypothetical protein [Ureibacillus sp. BA0131]
MRVYKKQLMIELVRLGHDLHHTERNKNNRKLQVYFFEDSEQLERDIAKLTGHEYVEKAHEN